MTAPAPRLAKHITPLAQVARELATKDRKPPAVAKALRKLYRADRAAGVADWWWQATGLGPGHVYVNLDALRARHPEVFEPRFVTRHEFDVAMERVALVEKKCDDLTRAKNKHGAAIRQLQLHLPIGTNANQ